ncbi:MAG: zinc-binding alcohol dehydrogenase family protein [Pyrinomonadaceae bacterium]
MRSIAVCGREVKNLFGDESYFEEAQIDGLPITCGLIHTRQPDFDPRATKNRFHALVRIKAFSCNYRDKALFFVALGKGGEKGYFVVGSDFVGEVIEVGTEVNGLKVGDKVIGNNNYIGDIVDSNDVFEGVATNHASKEYQIFHQAKLIKIPSQMPDTVAAAFSLNSQTAYSMIRKLEVKAGSNILLTAAKSNVALFVLNALRKYDVNVLAVSTSLSHETRLKELGVTELIKLNKAPDGSIDQQSLNESVKSYGKFDYVIDPFFDVHFGSTLSLMAPGGRYITCGLSGPTPAANGQPRQQNVPTLVDALGYAVYKNLQFIGNCLGLTQDLSNAIQDFAGDSYDVVIDSVFKRHQVANFFTRTFSDQERFGKVVYVYD